MVAGLIRHKFLVLGGLLAGLALAGAAILTQSPVYESRALFRIAYVGGAQVESPPTLVAEMKARHHLGTWGPAPRVPSRIRSVQLRPENGLIEITAVGPNAASARTTLQAALNQVLLEEQAQYEQAFAALKRRLTAVQAVLTRLNRAPFALARGAADNHSSQSDSISPALGWTAAGLGSLEQQITNLDAKLSPLSNQPPHAVAGPTVPVRPIRPRPLLYMLLGVVGGVIFGIILAALADWFSAAGPALRVAACSGRESRRAHSE
jgi:uncharacterized protein involved in exopolysaccharide biosynthesis